MESDPHFPFPTPDRLTPITFWQLACRLYCLARRSRRFHAGTDHNRVHLRCRIYDCRRFPNSQNTNQFLALVGESICDLLGLLLQPK